MLKIVPWGSIISVMVIGEVKEEMTQSIIKIFSLFNRNRASGSIKKEKK